MIDIMYHLLIIYFFKLCCITEIEYSKDDQYGLLLCGKQILIGDHLWNVAEVSLTSKVTAVPKQMVHK